MRQPARKAGAFSPIDIGPFDFHHRKETTRHSVRSAWQEAAGSSPVAPARISNLG